jgi:hypothetical protein
MMTEKSEGSPGGSLGGDKATVRPDSSFDLGAGSNFVWTARVRGHGDDQATAYARNQSFTVCKQASFAESDSHPSAVEYLLGALGGDLINGFAAAAARRGINTYALEASVSGRLNNPLVHLGFVGETGDPGFEAIGATLFVSADQDDEDLEGAWQEVLARSPLVNTLRRCVALSLEMKMCH